MSDPVVTRLSAVKMRLAKALAEAGRADGSCQLVAVSKTFEADDIHPVLVAGQRVFGENRVQESKGKWPQLRSDFEGVELHLIGPLQSNKAAEAVALFDVIETIDRPKIAQAVKAEMVKQGREIDVLVQINTGDEFQKAGVGLDQADQFIAECKALFGAGLKGLMCIPPVDQPATPHFKLLADLAAKHGLGVLSMGMSGDFEEAVASGSTHVRVGSAIFGVRTSVPA
jgi:PLP dependent protein